jgi:hypothetical protein
VNRPVWRLLHHHGVGHGVLHCLPVSIIKQAVNKNKNTYIAGSGGSMDACEPESASAALRAGGPRRWAGDMCPVAGVWHTVCLWGYTND